MYRNHPQFYDGQYPRSNSRYSYPNSEERSNAKKQRSETLTSEQLEIDKALSIKNGSKPKKKRLRDDAYTFVSTTSLHALPFVLRSRSYSGRIFWILIFLVGTGAMLWHLWLLTKNYLSYSLATTVNIKYEHLQFPSISVCNENALRQSLVFSANLSVPDAFREYVLGLKDTEEYSKNETNPGDRPPPANNKRRRKRSTKPKKPFHVNSSSELEQKSPQYERDPETNEEYGYGNTSTEYRNYETYSKALRLLDSSLRYDLGHQKNVLILSCAFNGIECDTENFTDYLSHDYGNCFTFNDFLNRSKSPRPQGLRVRGSGTTYGLSLLLYLERNEYTLELTPASGARVVISEFGSHPNIDHNGLSLSPGKEIDIGLKKVFIQRLKYQQHTCKEETNYLQLSYNYTQGACNSLCEDQMIYKYCNCHRPEFMEHYNDNQLLSDICESENQTRDRDCQVRILTRIRNAKLNCSCDKACYTTDYDLEMSMKDYPAETKWFTFINRVCEEDSHDCYYLQQIKKEDRRRVLRENFIKLNIFYRDLNFQLVNEDLSYELAQYLSDFGGSIGLWIGMSVITLIEVVDTPARMSTFFAKLDPKLPPIPENGQIECLPFLCAVKQIPPFFDLLGISFKIVKNDIGNNVEILHKAFSRDTAKYSTFDDIIQDEILRQAEKSKNSSSLSFLWLKRALEYMHIFLLQIVEDHEKGGETENLASFCQTAYEKTLKTYHGWFTRKAFSMISHTLPWKKDLLKTLAFNQDQVSIDEIINDTKQYLNGLGEIVKGMNSTIDKFNINFQDVV
ncbi:DgyrCDS5973 [Dimorphilus gyrociliatus]|uniref:DgyrCDS5973 n=1 Tax=Dimorphilus gyrociliatus TaxID=2664684 RepID=A0A7I8VLM4_9ANNE|nr:DgyrCDS5973 [Dimorphilus gyrociliatus]